MTTQIVVHLLPHEIDWFEWQSKQFKLGSYFVQNKIIIDVTLNLNLIDWKQSKLPKEFFITKFRQIESLWDWTESQFIIDEENRCLGCDDKRREAIRSTTADNILYLDSDIVFKPELLGYITEYAKLIKEEYYIISPQTVRLWDSSWDIITNTHFLDTPANMETYYGNDPFKVVQIESESIGLSPIETFKFGGGWFNLLSTKLLKLTDIPDSFGPYGIDDLYVMICCDLMKQKRYNVQQYVLEGIVVIENFKYRWNPYKDFLHSIDRQAEFRTTAEDNLQTEIQNFINKI
jgi:glycosyltransferase involved in cell wall biosynthesis